MNCTTEKENKHALTASAMNEDDAHQCEAGTGVDHDLQKSTASATVDDVNFNPVQKERTDEDSDSFFIDDNDNRDDLQNGVEERSSSEIINIDGIKHKEETAQLALESIPLDAKPRENDHFLLSWPIVPLAEKTKTSIPNISQERDVESNAKYAGPQETKLAQPDSPPVPAIEQLDTNGTDLEPAQPFEDTSPIKPSSSENDNVNDHINTNDLDEFAAEPQLGAAPRTPEAEECEATTQLKESILYTEELQEDSVECQKPPSSPMQIIPSLESGLNMNILRTDSKDDVSEPQEFEQMPIMSVFTEPSPPERTRTIVELSPAQENIPPGTTPSVTQTKHVSSVSSGGSHFNDEDDDEDEIILVGDKSSARWSRPTIRRVSKMVRLWFLDE
jgi:hypothetical protein